MKDADDGPDHRRPHGHLRRHRRCSACPRPSCVPELLRGPHHAAARRTGRRGWVEATTEDELVDAVAARRRGGRAAARPRRRQQPGRRRRRASPAPWSQVATRGVRPRRRRRRRLRRRHGAPSAAGENWDDLVARAVELGLGRRRGAVRHPRLGRRHPDPERRRLRPGGLPDHRRGPGLGPQAARRPHLRQRRLRLRLPHQPVQGRPGPPRRPRRHLPVPRRATSAPRSGTPSWPPRLGVEPGERAPLADVRAAVLDAAHAARAWCSTPTTTTPGAPARSSPTRSSPADAGCPTARPPGRSPTARVKTSAAWLIERAGFGKGYGLDRTAAGSASPPSTPWPSPTAATPRPRTCSRWPARSATGSSRGSASGWSTSRSWSACEL